MSSASVTAESPPVRRIQPPTPRVALVLFTAIVLGVVLYLGRSALTPFLVGALLIYILDPAVTFLARQRVGRVTVPRGLAVLIVYLITIFVVVEGLALLLAPLISQLLRFVNDLPNLLQSLDEALAQLSDVYRSLELPPAVREFIDGLLADVGQTAPSLDIGGLMPLARTILGTVAGFFGFLIIPVWAFYILRDRVRLRDHFEAALPAAWHNDVWAVVHIVDRVIGRWIRAQIVLGLIVGGATYLGLLLLGNFVDPRFLQFAVLLAVIAGVLELLPIIGPIISMVPTLLVALTTSDPIVSIVAVIVLYTVVQQVENAVLVPKIQGDALELHPSVIIFALIVGAAIAGLVGAIFSIPITAAARNVYRYLFRRLSEDDPQVPPVDAPDLRPLIEDSPHEAEPRPERPYDEWMNVDGTPGAAPETKRNLARGPAAEEDGDSTPTAHGTEE